MAQKDCDVAMFDEFILVVDNDRQSADLLKYNLEFEDYKVDVAYSAEEVLTRISDVRYGHFILDYAMPDMKGDELADRIRREQPDAQIILVTGFKPVLDESILEKFDYVFDKPADPRAIIGAIKGTVNPQVQAWEAMGLGSGMKNIARDSR